MRQNRMIYSRDYCFMILLLLLTMMGNVEAVDCIWDVQKQKPITQMPVRSYTSCQGYCRAYYSHTPQRAYYNLTSQMCEPRRSCTSLKSYYDYMNNDCFTDKNMSTPAQSIIYQKLIEQYSGIHSSMQMKCINGIIEGQYINGVAYCRCELFWKDSELVDINGYKFKCDQVNEDAAGIFYNRLTTDDQGNILKYGPFSAQEIKAIIVSLKQLQITQTYQYIYTNYQSILFSTEKQLKHQNIIRQQQIPLCIIFIICLFVLIGVSLFQYDKLMIPITKEQFKKKIIQTMNNDNPQVLLRTLN